MCGQSEKTIWFSSNFLIFMYTFSENWFYCLTGCNGCRSYYHRNRSSRLSATTRYRFCSTGTIMHMIFVSSLTYLISMFKIGCIGLILFLLRFFCFRGMVRPVVQRERLKMWLQKDSSQGKAQLTKEKSWTRSTNWQAMETSTVANLDKKIGLNEKISMTTTIVNEHSTWKLEAQATN